MKTLMILLTSVSGLLLFSTTVCGLWLRSNGAPPESVNFHVSIALATVVMAAITIGTLVVLAWKA